MSTLMYICDHEQDIYFCIERASQSNQVQGDSHVLQALSPLLLSGRHRRAGVEFELVSSAKVLGVVISSDLKWSAHIGSITTEAAKRFYLLRQLICAGIAHSVLIRFYCSVIRSNLEYACQVFHCNLLLYLSEDIERIQRRALRVIFPDCSYSEGLAKAGLTTLHDRRSTQCKELFMDIDTQGNHKLNHLLPVRSQQNYTLRSTRAFAAPVCKTNRFRNSFIISHCM